MNCLVAWKICIEDGPNSPLLWPACRQLESEGVLTRRYPDLQQSLPVCTDSECQRIIQSLSLIHIS
ncbi:hypothetical protein ACQ4LF_25220, partial [Aeromonas salmonicida]